MKQTPDLAKLLSGINGKEIDADDALSIGQQAVASIASVVSKNATAVIPVQASEKSRVLAKRLFTIIDQLIHAGISRGTWCFKQKKDAPSNPPLEKRDLGRV